MEKPTEKQEKEQTQEQTQASQLESKTERILRGKAFEKVLRSLMTSKERALIDPHEMFYPEIAQIFKRDSERGE